MKEFGLKLRAGAMIAWPIIVTIMFVLLRVLGSGSVARLLRGRVG